MRVSVALHRTEPKIGGNQREAEFAYMGYNRQYADLDADGHCVIDADFPPMGETYVDGDKWIGRFFSIGVCENVPQDQGGTILNYAPLYAPLAYEKDAIPKIKAVMKVEKNG